MKKLIVGVAIGVVLGSAIAAWTEVYPIRWDEPEAATRGGTADSLIKADGIQLTKHISQPFACDAATEGVYIFVDRAIVSDDLCVCQPFAPSPGWIEVTSDGACSFADDE